MFNRLLILALCIGLTALLGTGSDAVFANEGDSAWLTDGTIQSAGWQGLPDNQDRTAKFVVLDGTANNGLGRFAAAGQVSTMVLTFDRAPTDDCIRVALFDPNTIGRWDQRVDMRLVDKAPDVVYEVFAPTAIVDGEVRCTEDLLFDANFQNDPAPFLVTSAYKDYNKLAPGPNPQGLTVEDDVWVSLIDLSLAQAEANGLKLDDGRFRLVFRARLRPAPSGIDFLENHDPLTVSRDVSSFTGRERAAYKIAFNGTYLIPAGGVVGFAGGIIDERVGCDPITGVGCGGTEDDVDATTGAADPVRQVDPTLSFDQKDDGESYFYDGVFNFHIHSTQACRGDIDFGDADADWVDVANLTPNDFDANGFLTGPKLTGIPPENVGRYIRPNDLACDGKRDIGGPNTCADVDRLVGFDADPTLNANGVIKWNIFPVAGFPGHNTDPLDPTIVPTFSSDQVAFGGRPSITADQQLPLPPANDPFKINSLDAATLQATAGLWCLQWQGVDCANFVFLRFNRPVGTTPRPTLKIDVFCDENGNCERDDADFPVPLNDGKVALKLTEIDCETQLPIPGGLVMNITTDENGVWDSPTCPAMLPACYRLEFDGPPPLTAGTDCLDLPTVIDLRGEGQDSQCVTVELPRDCTGMLSGSVYCEQTPDDCSYDPTTDEPLPAGARIRIIATPTGPMGMGTPVETEVTGPATDWMIDGLEFGTYIVSYEWITDPIPLWDACSETRQVELTAQTPSVEDIDFGFDCATGEICGDVYCESTDDCLYDDGVADFPLPSGSVVTVTLSDATGAVVDTQTVTAPATRYCFTELPRGTYTITYAFAPGSVTWDLAPGCDDVKTATISAQNNKIDDCDFGFECVGDICGDVYCEFGRDCQYDPNGGDEPLPAGTKYIVTATPIVGGQDVPAGAVTKNLTAPVTSYCFEDLPLGQYRITVSEDPTTQASAKLPDLSPSCEPSRTVTLSAQTQKVDDVDFGYICFVDICGDVYCEETENCLLDAGTADGPLPDGTQVTVTIVQLVGGQPVPATLQTRTVTAPATRYCFERLPFGTYEISYAFVAGLVLDLAPDCDDVKTVTANAATGSIDDCDFGFVCDADLTGRVFCDVNLNGKDDLPPDTAPISATVEAQLIPASGPLPPALTTSVGAAGTFAFNDIPPGTYRVRVITIDPATWTPLFDNVNGIEVTIPTGESRNVLLPYDCRLCEIHGTVYCDDDLSGTLSLGDLRFEGVTVTATGPGGPFSTTTNALGEYSFVDLQPGLWVITVPTNQAPYNTAPPRPTNPQPVEYRLDCERGDRVMDKDFRSLCLGRIFGYVFQDPLRDCDGIYQPTDVPVDGARIRLTGPGILPAPNPRETVTNADGFYQFGDLPTGVYKVEILDPLLNKWVVLGLTLNEAATPREVPGIVLPRLGEQRVDFGFCIQQLEGYVFQDNPRQDCDGIYQPATDIPVDGARIRLTGPANLPDPNPRETTTDANGFYSFPNLVPGDYTVEILSPLPDKWEAINLTLVEDVTARVQDANLPLGEVERRDFGHCTQALSGKVFKQPFGYWDGVWNPDIDTPLEGILVELTGTSGNALNYTDSTRTNADGDYFFVNVPTGSYEIRLSDSDAQTIAILSGLIDDGQDVLTPTVDVGDRIPDLDFPKCECEQQLCVNVFREEASQCDGKYDEGVDTLAEFIKVRFEQLSTGRNTTLMTDADGRICLPILEPGDYKISIEPNQPELEDCRPSPGTVLERVVSFDPKDCADQELWFGFCCCVKMGCCEGKLHEVVMETRFWMCAPEGYQATARLFMDCGGDDLVDEAEASLVDGNFGSVPGIDGVVKIESIKTDGPLVTVRIRLTATGTRFPGKSFGNRKHLVTVTLNGETNQICEVFRAEVMRPGAIPGCKRWDEELCKWVPVVYPCEPGVHYREVDWDANECENLCWRFGIVEIWCFEDWCRCNCFCPPPECEPCKGKLTNLKLRYDGKESIWTVVLQSYDGRLLFEGEVKPGDVIPLVAKGDDGTMGHEIKLFTNQICKEVPTDCDPRLVIGSKWGPFTVVDGASSQGGPFCDKSRDRYGNEIDPECRECCKPERPCDCIAGVTHLAFRYNGDTPKWAVILQDFDGRTLFEGMVRPGSIIRVRAAGDDGTMGSTIKLLTNEFCGELDVSCAKPIGIGTTSGPFEVIGGASRDGGRFCGSPECKECPEHEPVDCPTCPNGGEQDD
ncbi:MAG: SdrD B-like domain-containing protein [Planctomycetota bacterium]|nr:SdrD B-like domain-containing protein [Planctomycetota bacterium]